MAKKDKWAKESIVVFDPNVTYEEDIEKAFQLCVDVFGPVGRYVHPMKNGVHGGIIFTPKFGKLWYGDIPQEEFGKLNTLQDQLGDVVSVLSE